MISAAFLLAGNATFTVELPDAHNPERNPHYTFKVNRSEPSERFPNPATFVKLLTGPNNMEDYTYIGMMHEGTGAVRTTAKSKHLDGSFVVRLIDRVCQRIIAGEGDAIEAAGFKVHHVGKCGRCGRPLTVPSSVESGIGPECAKIMAG